MVRGLFEGRQQRMSSYAARSRGSRGRDAPEEPSSPRTEFHRDRDRIPYSKDFRRIKHMSQVFVAIREFMFSSRLL